MLAPYVGFAGAEDLSRLETRFFFQSRLKTSIHFFWSESGLTLAEDSGTHHQQSSASKLIIHPYWELFDLGLI